jgi:hypothetical protein
LEAGCSDRLLKSKVGFFAIWLLSWRNRYAIDGQDKEISETLRKFACYRLASGNTCYWFNL